ncbi:MAG: Gfo/Idh/MocA family oxidoreductase [Nocardioides sp.]
MSVSAVSSVGAPLRVAVIGAGGFAGVHHTAIASLEESGEVRLVGTCDPAPDTLAKATAKWDFARRSVRTFDDYRAMLAALHGGLDGLLVPTPVPLHAEMHRAGVEHGIPVYLEKPPTLDWEELETMIAVDRAASRATNVGFNHIVEPTRRALKRRLCAGVFGALREVRFLGLSGRPEKYYARNNWAGRLLVGDRILIDSCLSNAMAHYAHNVLFWAGAETEMQWADLAAVEATLHRAHAIEGADTALVAARTTKGVSLRLGMTHAWAGDDRFVETLVCDGATIHYRSGGNLEIEWRARAREVVPLAPAPSLRDNLRAWLAFLRGEVERPTTTLADCRPFALLNSLAILSSGEIFPLVHDRRRASGGNGEEIFRVAHNIEPLLEAFVERGERPGLPPTHVATTADLPKLRTLLRQIAHDSLRSAPSTA